MRLRPLLLLAVLVRLSAAQTTHAAPRVQGATISGVVRDSIARAPLAGATVQLVAADDLARFGRTTISDSLGRYSLADIPDGRYTIGFFHPILEALGMEPPLRELQVDGERPIRADLAIPSALRLRSIICGPQFDAVNGAVVVGVVRDAQDHAPAAGVTVTGEWIEFTLRPGGLVRRIPRLIATTGENGSFAMCNVPTEGSMSLMASRGQDSSDLIEVEVPGERFLRRELYLGPRRTLVVGVDSVRRADSVARRPRRLHLGDGRVTGTVIGADELRPLRGAVVGIVDGPQTRANDRGEFTLVDAPTGTRVLEVRAVGYYPQRRPVDVVSGALPVHVTMSTLKAVLDTVRVRAARLSGRNASGFDERRRTGAGRYFTAADITKRQISVTSEFFKSIAGMRLEVDEGGFDKRIQMRGVFEDWCLPTFFLDGLILTGLTADDFDTWVRPHNIVGIEIYSETSVPPGFQQGVGGGCGTILFWTK